MLENDQTEFKNTVKQWLKSHGLDYRWMADRCGVSEITVRNWMSQKNIPLLKQQLIERVMVQLPISPKTRDVEIPGVQVNATVALTIQLVPELYQRLSDRASSCGMTPEALVAQAVSDLVSTTPLTQMTMKNREVILPPKQ